MCLKFCSAQQLSNVVGYMYTWCILTGLVYSDLDAGRCAYAMARNLYLKRLTDALGSFSDWESVGGDSERTRINGTELWGLMFSRFGGMRTQDRRELLPKKPIHW
jgi:hypothetical protein